MKLSTILTVLIVLVIIAAGGIYFVSAEKSSQEVTPTISTQTNTMDPSATPTPEEAKLRAGGSSYADPKGVYSVLYPNDWKQDSPGDGMTRFYKNGPTQKGQTEMYDGVIVHIESVDLGTQTLSAWVDDRLKSSTADGTSEVVEPKKNIIVGGYPGFEYTLRGLGTFRYVVLQKDSTSKSAVNITTLVADPTKVGFQQEVDAVLKTLELLK